MIFPLALFLFESACLPPSLFACITILSYLISGLAHQILADSFRWEETYRHCMPTLSQRPWMDQNCGQVFQWSNQSHPKQYCGCTCEGSKASFHMGWDFVLPGSLILHFRFCSILLFLRGFKDILDGCCTWVKGISFYGICSCSSIRYTSSTSRFCNKFFCFL